MDDRRSSSYRRTSWNVGLGGADVPSIDPGPRRPYGGRQDRGRCRVGRVRVHQRRVRRCPSGIPGARYRHSEAVRRAAGPRAAPRTRRRRAGGALQRRPLRARRGAMARTNPRRGPSPGRRRWNRFVRTRAGGGPVPRAPARPGATRAAARLGGGADAGAARPLGGATRPPVRGGRATAGGAGRRGRAAHGAGPQLVAGARPRDRGDAAVVHSTHVAPGRAAPSHRSTRGRDARGGPGGRAAADLGDGRGAARPGARRGGISRGGCDARRAASGAGSAGSDRGGDPALREATGDLVSKSTTRCGRRDAGCGRRVDARRVRGAPGAGPPHRGALARRDPSRIPHPASRSMRIGITCYPTYGGSGAVATELGLELARRGHEVHFISYASPFRLRGYAERVTFHEVTQTEYPLFEQSSPYALALAVKQHEVAMRENLDLKHVHYAIPHAATAWLAKQMLKSQRDLKIVTTLHGTDITLVGQDPSYYTLTKFSIEQSDRVTAVSTFLRNETYRAFGCAGCDVVVIPNFVAVTEYHPAVDAGSRRSLAPAGHKVLVHVSNFRPVKRVRDVVRVFAGIRRELPATLVLVGDGPDRDAAEQEADRLKLGRDVRFLGKVDNVADILRGSDLFLLPSETESFGLAALEAMACAVPVLASAVGGLPEVVVDGETGFLTPPGDIDAMIVHGVRALRDGALHARLRDAAARRALEFAADRVVPRYEQLYQDVLGA